MKSLLTPLQAGALVLNNRLVMPPMATSKSQQDGKVSQDILDYYNEKSRGGYISLIIIEHSFISQQGKASSGQLSIAEDSVVEELKKLSEVIHKNGSKCVMQINHAGIAAKKEVTGMEIVGPSAAVSPLISKGESDGSASFHELTSKEIAEIVSDFSNAARRVKEAGFDGVEIHSAHGYLLHQFFSPLSNSRTDEYGGSLLNRIRIHLEVIKAVREAVGNDYPVLLRMGAADYIEGGADLKDSITAALEYEKARVDILDISGGFRGFTIPGYAGGQGYFAPITEAIRQKVAVPVILTGGITDAEAAEELLAEGKADLIGVGRAILQDSEWAKQAILSLSEK